MRLRLPIRKALSSLLPQEMMRTTMIRTRPIQLLTRYRTWSPLLIAPARMKLGRWSNFGKKTVHLAAPGSDILSTWLLNDSSYETTSGTSMAAPYVAGALALMKAQFPNSTHTDLIAKLLKTVDKLPSLAGKVTSDGRLNLQAALQ